MTLPLMYKGVVYPWHCDHMGHMNVMWYVGKFDEATWNLFNFLGISAEYLKTQKRAMAGVQQNIAYKQELVAGDVVEVRSRILEMRDKALRVEHEMRHANRDSAAAVMDQTAVHLDALTRKATPFPDEIRQRAVALIQK
ncbi:MAG TPA: thioesterase family protein [Candidatus Polarisedimenticolia bacterium]|jgi:acyl-CoA thioester hydrolase|nr:thioesterase family protein [Candidatus Polarisedimenticolia bacterium]